MDTRTRASNDLPSHLPLAGVHPRKNAVTYAPAFIRNLLLLVKIRVRLDIQPMDINWLIFEGNN